MLLGAITTFRALITAVEGTVGGEPTAGRAVAAGDGPVPETYTADRLAKLRTAGPVFVNFTAAWCITCKVNEQVALSSSELEDAFAAEDLGELAKRFSSGRLSARDMQRVIGAGLRGGGHAVSQEDVQAMRCEEGLAGLARVVSALLVATFGGAEEPAPNP